MPLGPEQLAVRRNVVLDAADHLIRSGGSTDFTMMDVAKRAGVSPTTPYNLFETKAGLLYALLNRSMDGIDAVGSVVLKVTDPWDRIGQSARAAARFYTSDPDFYRALYRFLLGVHDPIHRPALMQRAFAYWDRATSELEASHRFPAEFPREELVFQLTTNFLGVTDVWIHQEVSNADYVDRVTRGAISLLLALAPGRRRRGLLEDLGRLQRNRRVPGGHVAKSRPE